LTQIQDADIMLTNICLGDLDTAPRKRESWEESTGFESIDTHTIHDTSSLLELRNSVAATGDESFGKRNYATGFDG